MFLEACYFHIHGERQRGGKIGETKNGSRRNE